MDRPDSIEKIRFPKSPLERIQRIQDKAERDRKKGSKGFETLIEEGDRKQDGKKGREGKDEKKPSSSPSSATDGVEIQGEKKKADVKKTDKGDDKSPGGIIDIKV